MNIRIILFAIITMSRACSGQNAFVNLDFESANPVSAHDPTYPSAVTSASALPGWNVYCGGVLQTAVFQNNASAGSATADLFGPTQPPLTARFGGPGIINGNYTVVLQAGYEPSLGKLVDTYLEQTGLIPAADMSLEFKAWKTAFTTFAVSFNGSDLPLIDLGPGANYELYGVDISAFSGQSGALEFTALQTGGLTFLELDDITFSTQAVAEPSPLMLAGFGGLMFLLRRRFAANKR